MKRWLNIETNKNFIVVKEFRNIIYEDYYTLRQYLFEYTFNIDFQNKKFYYF